MWILSRAMACGRSTCSQAQAAESSEACSSDGAQSAPSRSTSSAARCSAHDRTTDPSSRSRSGTTFGHSTDDPGEAAAMSCVADFRARTYLPSETAPEYEETSHASGTSSPGSPERSSRSGYSRKTPQTSRSLDSTSCYKTLPRSGTMRNGSVYQRPSSAPLTSETGYGYLPGAASYLFKKERGRLEETVRRLARGEDARLPEKVFAFWPTPTRTDAKNKGTPSQLLRKYIPLSCRVRMLPDGRFDASGGRANPEFVEWLMAWPMSWTALSPLGTDRLRTWRQRHSLTLLQDSDIREE